MGQYRFVSSIIIYGIAILGSCYCATGQHLYFSTLSAKDGLPSNIISGIAQDKNDFIWIGTGNGLVRFDGNRFKTFQKNESVHSLSSNEISCLFAGDDYLWVGTWNGLCKINTITYDVSRIESVKKNAVRTLFKGLHNTTWIGTENGLIHYDNASDRILKTLTSENSGLSHNTIRSIYQDDRGTLWVGTYNKLNKLSPGGEWFEVFDIKGNYKPSLKNNLVCGEIKPYSNTADSLLWIGTETGLCLFNTKTGRYELFGDQNVPLSNEVIKCIYKNDDGKLWLGTDFGLNVFDPEKKTSTAYFHNPQSPYSLANNAIWQIFEDRGGVIWLVTSNGLSRLNKFRNNYVYHEVSNQVANQTVGNQVKSILITKKNIVWLATLHGVIRIDPKTNQKRLFDTKAAPDSKILLNNSYALAEDNFGNIWIGTAGGINIWNESKGKMHSITANAVNGLITNYVARFIKDDTGTLWVSTYQGGLFKIEGNYSAIDSIRFKLASSEFASEKVVAGAHSVWYTIDNDLFQLDIGTLKKQRIPGFNNLSGKKDIHCLFFSGENILWAGTENGLLKFNPANGSSEFCPIITGQDIHIGNLEEDNLGNIWGATNSFIFKNNPNTRQTEMFPLDKDLPLKNFFYGCSSRSPLGKISFGGDNGFITVDTEQPVPNSYQPKVFITALEINNRVVSAAELIDGKILLQNDISFTPNLTLDYAQRSISFEFSSLHYWQPSMNVFAYKLDGFDEDWIYVSGQKNFAVYSNLSPRKYTFRVKGTNNYGLWSDNIASVEIEVKPPFFLSPAFIILYGVLILAVIIFGLRIYSIRLKLRNEIKITRLEKMHMEELAQAKQQFFTNLSHELRTPISLIMPPIHQILRRGNLDDESRSLIRLAEKNSHRLLRVINQILDFGKLENDHLPIKVTTINLVCYCQEIHSLFIDKANRKKIDFRYEPAVQTLNIWIDTEKIETVLFNLLSNAFKFTPVEGKISLAVHQIQKSKTYPDGAAEIRITDTGIGLDPEDKTKIFEPFYQTREARQLEMGTGIGLALAAEYVKLHHGQIEVESTKGAGASFIIHLPLGRAHFPVDSIHEEKEIELIAIKEMSSGDVVARPYRYDLDSDKPLILMVDDNNDMIDFVRLSLSPKYNFISTENGEEALQKSISFLPQIIISDIMMPVMDGLALCRKIKENPKTSHISIILLTAKGQTSQKIEGIRMGADVYITKPFEIEFLEANIDHLLDRRKELIDYLKNSLNLEPGEESGKENEDDKFIKKVMNIIEANISNTNFGVEVLSAEIGMSSSYLYRKLKSLTHLSTNEIIKRYRIKKASILLKNKGGNVTEIMHDVGFSNLSYFSKCFKVEFGLNPKDYQQKMSKNSVELDLNSET